MSKTRTFVSCRICGSEHRNPKSSSLCETCGLKEAEANRLRKEEEMEAELAYWQKDSADACDKCEDNRVKLAKAVEALKYYAQDDDDGGWLATETLAELTGGKDE